VVYIEEAHALDAWQDDDNIKAHIFLHSTRTLNERCSVAGTCLTKLGVEFPAVVDDLVNTTERAYTAWPDRLYVIDRDGRVAYKSKPGPFGFKPEEVSQTLQRLFPKARAALAPLPPTQAAAAGTSAIQ
jgi:Iodothyronine deiodinase